MYDLGRITKAWLTSDPEKLGVLERIVMDKYMRSLPYEAKKIASQQNPGNINELVSLVESQRATTKLLRTNRGGPEVTPRIKRTPSLILLHFLHILNVVPVLVSSWSLSVSAFPPLFFFGIFDFGIY